MLNQSYVNTTLGEDLLNPEKKNNFAFITNTADEIGMVTDDFIIPEISIQERSKLVRYRRVLQGLINNKKTP